MKSGVKPKPLAERFWKYVDKRGPDDCWEWNGGRDKYGYGRLQTGTRPSRLAMKAHRISYELHIGPLGDLFCLHMCDNPSCVNPHHLFAGTQQDNVLDMKIKNRGNDGVKNGTAKLDPSKVRGARLYRMNGWSYQKIANRFNVQDDVIRKAILGITWDHVR